MALSQVDIENKITKYFESKEFTYEAPFLYKEDSHAKYVLVIQASNLGRITLGRGGIKIKEVEELVGSILKKHNISINEWSVTVQESEILNVNIGNLKADSEKELLDTFDIISNYLEEIVEPFWNKYNNLSNIFELIQIKSEQQLNQQVFQGVKGIMSRLLIANHMKADYYVKKREFYMNLLKEYSINKPNEYSSYYDAFKDLIDTLENPKDA